MTATIKELKGLQDHFICYNGNGSAGAKYDISKPIYSLKKVRAKTLIVADHTGTIQLFIYHNTRRESFKEWRVYTSKTGLWTQDYGSTKKNALNCLQKHLNRLTVAQIKQLEDNAIQRFKDKGMKKVAYVGAEQ